MRVKFRCIVRAGPFVLEKIGMTRNYETVTFSPEEALKDRQRGNFLVLVVLPFKEGRF